MDAAQANNAAVGEATGCWKAGMLVEDGQGSVAAALQVPLAFLPSKTPKPLKLDAARTDAGGKCPLSRTVGGIRSPVDPTA